MKAAECVILYRSLERSTWTAVYMREGNDGKLVQVFSVDHADKSNLMEGLSLLLPTVARFILDPNSYPQPQG